MDGTNFQKCSLINFPVEITKPNHPKWILREKVGAENKVVASR